MSRLKDKLEELGYVKITDFIYIKYLRNLDYLKVDLEICVSTFTGRLSTDTTYYGLKEANDFIKAYNQLQKDLEVLKEYEKI